jgi:N-acetylmuramoyl-L-alanine amidase
MKLIFLSLLFTLCSEGKVILVDPGHGGNDLGTKGSIPVNPKSTIFEKDVALKLAKYLKEELQRKHQVYLTRLDDSYVSLDARAKMADTVKADLFLSLHFNSNTDKSAQGIETFYLDNHNDVAVKKVEVIENVGLEGKSTVINHILIDLSIKMTTKESKKLAQHIHNYSVSHLKKKYSLKDRGYKPGLLYVLALSKRPGVLVEGGFMSNSKEMQRINNDMFLKRYAQGIALGVEAYFQK